MDTPGCPPRAAFVLLALIAALRVGYVVAVGPQQIDYGDAPEYRALAASLAAGDGFALRPG